MTRIGAIQGGVVAARRAARGAGGFALPGRPEASEADPVASAAGIGALLAVQEGPAAAGDREGRALRQAEAALDGLRDLQLDLLRGRDDPARLETLAELAGSAEVAGDPALRHALAGIALRARVELARRRVASASSV